MAHIVLAVDFCVWVVQTDRKQGEAPNLPKDVVVEKGDWIDVTAHYGVDGLSFHFGVAKSKVQPGTPASRRKEL